MSKSTASAASLKPYTGYPLTPHRGANQWCKRHRKHTYYFGVLADWQAALKKYEHDWPFIITGRTPPAADSDGLTVGELCNRFLNAKLDSLRAGEITRKTFADYNLSTDRIVEAFGSHRSVEGLTPEDFAEFRAALAQTRGPTALGNEIQRGRTVFKFAFDNRLVIRPVHFGTSFDKPSAKSVRKARAAKGPQMFSAEELRRITGAADQPLKAMILLAINCAYGAADIASLPQTALNLADGWIDFARAKTAIPRRCALWPQTVEAVRQALESRPLPRDPADSDLVFVTPRGGRWLQLSASDDRRKWASRTDRIGREFRRLLDKLAIDGGRGFYCCRRTFQTVAEEQSADFPAVAGVMGHAPRSGDMSAVYRQRISDTRLQGVADVVRAWLFGTEGGAA